MSKASKASPQTRPMFGPGSLRQDRPMRSGSVVASRCQPLYRGRFPRGTTGNTRQPKRAYVRAQSRVVIPPRPSGAPPAARSHGARWCCSPMNSCPCGYAASGDGRCRCQPGVVERYAGRISGPLRDRMDMWVHMPRVEPDEYVRSAAPEASSVVAGRIAEARLRQIKRSGVPNSRLSGRALRAACALGSAQQTHAVQLAELEGWSARGIERLLRVARTAADLAGSDRVESTHLDEAARFRAPRIAESGLREWPEPC